VPVLMEPPIAQFRRSSTSEGGDPFGIAPVSLRRRERDPRAPLPRGARRHRRPAAPEHVPDVDVERHAGDDMNRRDGTPLEVLTKDDMPIVRAASAAAAAPHRADARARRPRDGHRREPERDRAGARLEYSASGEAKKVAIARRRCSSRRTGRASSTAIAVLEDQAPTRAGASEDAAARQDRPARTRRTKSRHFVGADMIGVSAVSLIAGLRHDDEPGGEGAIHRAVPRARRGSSRTSRRARALER
jgi:hypothetical protein